MRRRTLLNTSSGGIDPTAGRKKIGNYEVVDLGLPSGLLWATCNVGATKEEGYGNYYQWGAGSVTYKNEDQYHTGFTMSGYVFPSSADTATQVMGSSWRMPTETEFQELTANTTHSVATINGVSGSMLISKTNPKAYVFFPFAGDYYNGTLINDGINAFVWFNLSNFRDKGACFFHNNKQIMTLENVNRVAGVSVRGVHAAV